MKDNNAPVIIGFSIMILGVVVIGAPLLLGHKPLQQAQPGSATVSAPPLAKSAAGAGDLLPGAQSEADLVTANNTAVKLLQENKIQEAIDLLEPIVKANPQYGLGRDNLAIAYNNLALKQTDNPRNALDSLWRSACLRAGETKTSENIDDMVKYLHRDPRKFDDRVEIADKQLKEGCLYGAYCEYLAALKIRDDFKLRQKIKDMEKQAAACSNDDINGAFFIKMAMLTGPGSEKTAAQVAGKDAVDYGAYMTRLQKEIKLHWSPPRRNSSKRTQVQFTVARDGTISKVTVCKSSGDALEDKAGVDAVEKLGKADPLPAGSPPSVDIQFTFDYNVFGASEN